MQPFQTHKKQLNRLFNIQAARTYEYFLLYRRVTSWSADIIYRSLKMWISCDSNTVDENWHNIAMEVIKHIPNERAKYLRMFEAKKTFENAGGIYRFEY